VIHRDSNPLYLLVSRGFRKLIDLVQHDRQLIRQQLSNNQTLSVSSVRFSLCMSWVVVTERETKPLLFVSENPSLRRWRASSYRWFELLPISFGSTMRVQDSPRRWIEACRRVTLLNVQRWRWDRWNEVWVGMWSLELRTCPSFRQV